MKRAVILFLLLCSIIFSQDFPISWSQSYCTYDLANVHEPGHYSLGFSLDNYCIYTPHGEHSNDTIAYDQRRFDIFAKLGLFNKTELEIKYSYPTSGIIAFKYRFIKGYVDLAFKLGFAYMKCTRIGKITDYVFDFYPTFILSKEVFKNVKIFLAPKIIYSIHIKDRQEHSEREPRYIFQYGYGFGFSIGDKFSIIPETNWLFGNNMGAIYSVHQFGLGINLNIR
jgi:hypothetical protein